MGLTIFIIILIILVLISLDIYIRTSIRIKNQKKNGTYVRKWPLTFKGKIEYLFKEIKSISFAKIKRVLFGRKFSDGLVFKILIYTLLVAIGYVYVYPVLYMLSMSLKTREDIINPAVMWVPTSFYTGNYTKAFSVLKYFPTLLKSTAITLLPAILVTLVSSVIGYGLAKFNFRGKKIWFVLILLTFIVPTQVYMIPKYKMLYEMNLINKPASIILPAVLGQGLNSAIFILIFYQFFRMIPHQIEEAAQIDGAGAYKRFFLIGIPLAIPAFIVSFLFSFVWYWNETYQLSLFLSEVCKEYSLQIRLGDFVADYNTLYASDESIKLNEGIRLSATLLIMLPMLTVYFVLQRWFVEGVERSGITGE